MRIVPSYFWAPPENKSHQPQQGPVWTVTCLHNIKKRKLIPHSRKPARLPSASLFIKLSHHLKLSHLQLSHHQVLLICRTVGQQFNHQMCKISQQHQRWGWSIIHHWVWGYQRLHRQRWQRCCSLHWTNTLQHMQHHSRFHDRFHEATQVVGGSVKSVTEIDVRT